MRHSRSGLAAFQATAMVVALGVADKSVAQGDYEQVEHARRRAEEQQRIHANFSELLRRARDGKGFPIRAPREEQSAEEAQINDAILEAFVAKSGLSRIDALMELLMNPEHKALYLARPHLVALGREAIAPLRAFVANRTVLAIRRLEAARALVALGDVEGAEAIRRGIGEIAPGADAEEMVAGHYIALRTAALTKEQVVQELLSLLRETTPYFGGLTREMLIDVGEAAVPGLVDILTDRNLPLLPRLDASWSLGWIGGSTATRALANLMLDDTEANHLRWAAAAGLKNLADPGVAPALRKVTETWAARTDSDVRVYNVRREAEAALANIREGKKSDRRRSSHLSLDSIVVGRKP